MPVLEQVAAGLGPGNPVLARTLEVATASMALIHEGSAGPAAPRLDALRAAVDEPGPVQRELLAACALWACVSNEQAAVAADLAERAIRASARPVPAPTDLPVVPAVQHHAAVVRPLRRRAARPGRRPRGGARDRRRRAARRHLLPPLPALPAHGRLRRGRGGRARGAGAAGLARRALPPDGHDRARRVPARAGRPRRRGAGHRARWARRWRAARCSRPWCGTSAAGSPSPGAGRTRPCATSTPRAPCSRAAWP